MHCYRRRRRRRPCEISPKVMISTFQTTSPKRTALRDGRALIITCADAIFAALASRSQAHSSSERKKLGADFHKTRDPNKSSNDDAQMNLISARLVWPAISYAASRLARERHYFYQTEFNSTLELEQDKSRQQIWRMCFLWLVSVRAREQASEIKVCSD